jgi:hypothetical protein
MLDRVGSPAMILSTDHLDVLEQQLAAHADGVLNQMVDKALTRS